MLALTLWMLAAAPEAPGVLAVVSPNNHPQAAAVRAAVEEQVKARKLGGLVWGSSAYDRLFIANGLLGMTFETFDEPPPTGWPAALEGDWKNAVAACRSLLGPPPFKGDPLHAFACSTTLGGSLWQRLLTHQAPKDVVVVTLHDLPGGAVMMKALRHAPSAANGLGASAEVPAAQAGTKARDVLAQLFDGKGTAETRAVLDQPPAVVSVDAMAFPGEDGDALAPVALKSTCPGLPAELTIVPKDAPLAKALAARWKKSVTGATGTAACELLATEQTEAVAMTAVKTRRTRLACGAVPGNGVVSLSVAKQPLDKLTESTLNGLAKALCVAAKKKK